MLDQIAKASCFILVFFCCKLSHQLLYCALRVLLIFLAPLKLPVKNNVLEIAEAMTDKTDTGCFHTVGKKD